MAGLVFCQYEWGKAVRIEANRTIEVGTRAAPARSQKSLAFQQAWASIPKEGLVPDKSAFRPERLAAFLNDIFLVELTDNPGHRLTFRLAGQAIRDGVGCELRGMNYSDFVPAVHREHAGSSMLLMFGPRPCGRWISKEVVHPDGFHEPIELTQLPMLDAATGTRLILGIAEGFGTLERHEGDGNFLLENRDVEHFIDIGAGVPE